MKLPFQLASVMQLSLMWSAYRFRPGAQFTAPWFVYVDWVSAILLVATNLAIDGIAVSLIIYGGKGMYNRYDAIAPLCGSMATWLLSIYPIHLALEGEQWVDCISQTYPAQKIGFAGYVYIPASWVFSAMMFGVTLVDRKILHQITFGLIFGVAIMGILLCTIISQEIHIPFVST